MPDEVSNVEENAKNHIKDYWSVEIVYTVSYIILGILLMLASGFINRDIKAISGIDIFIILYSAVFLGVAIKFTILVIKEAKTRLKITTYIYNSLIKDKYISPDAVTFDFRHAPILFLEYIIDKCDYVEGKKTKAGVSALTKDGDSKKKWGIGATGFLTIMTLLFNPRGENDGPSLFERLVTFTSPVFSRNSEMILRGLFFLAGVFITVLVTQKFSKKTPQLLKIQPEYELVSISKEFAKQELDRRISEVGKQKKQLIMASNENEVSNSRNILTGLKNLWKTIWEKVEKA